MANEWDKFESGNYDGGLNDLSVGGQGEDDFAPDWQDTVGAEDDLAQQWLDSNLAQGRINNPTQELGGAFDILDSMAAQNAVDMASAQSISPNELTGIDTDAAILNARLRSTGLPITANNTIGAIPEHMRPSDVTHYDLSGLKPEQRQIDSLTIKNVMQGNISTVQANDITNSQQRQFDKILATAQRGDTDALPAIQGHADNLTKEDFSIGGKSVDEVMYSLAGKYVTEGTTPEMQKLLSKQLAIQIPRTSRGMQASFGSDVGMVSHLDALPLPNALPDMFQGNLKQTLNMGGGGFDPDYKESREYRFASKSDQASMDYFNKPSAMSTLTGMPYQGMHKTQEQLSKLDPMQHSALEAQKDIEADFKGFLSLAGLAKDITGRKLSGDNSQGTAQNFIRPVVGADYYGTSNLDELARHGLMEEAGFGGENGKEGQMSSLGNYADKITGASGNIFKGNPINTGIDFNRPFTESDLAGVITAKESRTFASIEEQRESELKDRVASDLREGRTINPTVAKVDMRTPSPIETPSSTSAIASKSNDVQLTQASPEAQANVEAALTAKGLNISNAAQGSPEWHAARTTTLTSTGIATSMAEPVYGETWLGHVSGAINAKNNPEIAGQVRNPMYTAGERGEQLGKEWFKKEFDKDIVDLGLVTDPNKPNQGTSVDGVVTGRDGSVGANLELVEFKWGTRGQLPKGAKTHEQQLQHQMYMTGADSVNFVRGFDPNQFSPRAGNEAEYKFASEPVFRDPDWANNNADFIQARANEKAGAVESGSVEGLKQAYLSALNERYPNESDKGLTKEERSEKKRQEQADREEEKELRKEQKESTQRIKDGATFLASGAGGGINRQSTTNFIGGLGVGGMVASAVIGAGSAVYDGARAATNYVGSAADMGADSTGGMLASKVALKAIGFNDSQAKGFTRNTFEQQAMASVGEFDPLVKRLTAYRGLVSMEDLTSLTPAELTDKLQSKVEDGTITRKQLAGMATMAGDSGVARNFLDGDARGEILDAEGKARATGLSSESTLRANVATMNVTAVNLNMVDAVKKALIETPSGIEAGKQILFQPSENLQSARDRWSDASNASTLQKFKFWASDEEDAAVAQEYKDAMSNVKAANKMEREAIQGGQAAKLDSNIHVVLENKQATTTLNQSVNGVEQPTQTVVSKEE